MLTKTGRMEKRSCPVNQQGRLAMRIGYAAVMAALLVSAPAMAQVIIGGDNDSVRHEQRADQDRAAGRQEMGQARADAARGDYADAARDQQAAREDWHAAHHQQHDADRDSNGGVTVQLGR
jgi:hypothetical protein